MKKLLLTFAAVAAFLIPAATRAADYAVQKTFWSFSAWTNVVNAVTNVAAAMDCTQFPDFALSVIAKGTNNTGGGGTFNVVWEVSPNGTDWPAETNLVSRNSGWFGIPIQSNNVATVWTTNITMDAIGYFRIRHITNASGMNWTNIQVLGYVKPKRTNRDF